MFGIGTLLVTGAVFPAACLLIRDEDRRRRRLQHAFSGGCRFFIWFMKALGLLNWQVTGVEHLTGRGRLIVANHPTLIDAVFFLAWMPEAVCIVKHALQRNPFLGWAIASAGYIGNADPESLIADCVAGLRAGQSLIVFPEGTRTVPGQAARFKRGAARIALGAGVPVVPVRISCEPITLTKGTPWYRVPERAAQFRFEIGAPITADEYSVADDETKAHAARRLTQLLQLRLAPTAGEAGAAL
ncbi:MAG TPA: lysophospholipid acyltransferase family protein [Nevskiaceae bacterium]|nr:lysophospholipid acyltransferase family protein [Nevskiaceae bacterium]